MKMLADQKETQVGLQAIMKGVQTLVHKAVNITIREFKDLLNKDGCSHTDALKYFTAENIIPDVFVGLHTQHSQIKHFKQHFGLIMPQTITMPSIPEDFGRHKTRCDQSFRQQTYVHISILDQIEQILNVSDIYYEIMTKKIDPSEPGIWSR